MSMTACDLKSIIETNVSLRYILMFKFDVTIYKPVSRDILSVAAAVENTNIDISSIDLS